MVGEDGIWAVDFIGRVEHVREDELALVQLINSRLPEGVAPLREDWSLADPSVALCE